MTLPAGWKSTSLGSVLERVTLPVDVDVSREYREIGIRSHGKGIFHKPPVTGESLGEKRVFWVVPNTLALNIVFAWEQAVAVTSENEIGMIASHRFPMYRPIRTKCDVRFLLHYFKTPKGKDLLELASPGGAGRNKTLGQKEFERLKFPIPSAKEQARLALILDTWQQAIEVMKELLLSARQEKQAQMRRMLAPHHPTDWKRHGWRRAPLGEIVVVDSESLSSVTPPDFKFRYISLADVSEGKISSFLPLLVSTEFLPDFTVPRNGGIVRQSNAR